MAYCQHARTRREPLFPWPMLACLLTVLASGCAAVTNPTANGIPVRRLPPELLAEPRGDTQAIALPLLAQKAPNVYRLAPGDVLGVWVEGVLGDKEQPPPTYVPGAFQDKLLNLPPAVGYPFPVGEDGTVTLPQVEALPVQGLTLAEARAAIRTAYTVTKRILQPGRAVFVSLISPRQFRVAVVRQESSNFTIQVGAQTGGFVGTKGGTAYLVDLPAYENDVFHALARTGGMPGLDAYDEVWVERSGFQDDPKPFLATLEAGSAYFPPGRAAGLGGPSVRIPLRLRPGEPLPFGPGDVVLQTGDVVYIEARDQDVFYTAGLLPSGEFVLPRDYDLDVLTVVARVQGPLVSGGFVINNSGGAPSLVTAPGIGNPSPSLLTVLRRIPGGGQVPIRVDLNRALTDARERILVQPGDVLLLQEKPKEALARYLSETFFNFNLIWRFVDRGDVTGVVDVSSPNRLPSRLFLKTD